MPIEGFISPTDPLWLSTLDGMNQQPVSDSLVYRYNPAASPDGLHGDEGTFSLCTFLYVDAMARAGRLDDAVLDAKSPVRLLVLVGTCIVHVVMKWASSVYVGRRPN